MSNIVKLLQAAIQAVEAEAFDLAADFTERALRDLRAESGLTTELPWSTDPGDAERFSEFVKRAAAFLDHFAEAGDAGVPEDQARMLARRFFSEQPRAVGPTFYRSGILETDRTGPVTIVRLTKAGVEQLAEARRIAAQVERGAGVY